MRISIPMYSLFSKQPVFTALFCLAFAGSSVALAQHTPRPLAPVHRDPIAYDIDIAPTLLPQGSSSLTVSDDHWSTQGVALNRLIAQLYDADESTIDLPPDIQGARYDAAFVLRTGYASTETMKRLLQDAVEKRFQIAVTRRRVPVLVYILTAPYGPGPALHSHQAPPGTVEASLDKGDSDTDNAQRVIFDSKDCEGVVSGAGISMFGGSVGDLGKALGQELGKIVVDNTGLIDRYDFSIGAYSTEDDLFRLLYDKLGLLAVPSQRTVDGLLVRKTAAVQTQALVTTTAGTDDGDPGGRTREDH